MSTAVTTGATITNEPLTQPLLEKPKRLTKAELELKKRSERLHLRNHPLERAGIFSSTFLWWVNPFLWIGNRGALEQKVMPDVPRRDRVEANEEKLLGVFGSKGSLGSSIFKMYKWNFLKCAILMMFTQACVCSLALFMYFLIEDMAKSQDSKDPWDDDRKLRTFGIWYACIVGCQLGGVILTNYVSFDFSRTGTRLKNSVIFAVYRKILKISVMNKTQHTEANILNYVQTDCQKIEESISKFSQILESFWQILLGYAICIYLIKYNVVSLIVTFFLLTCLTLYLYKFIKKFEIQFLVAKDKKLQLLKNVLKNVKYVKLKVWEKYYHVKLYIRREAELSAINKSNGVFCIVFFLNWINPTTALIVSVLTMVYFKDTSSFEPAKILAFMKIVTTILRGMGNIPVCIQFFMELKVSLNRLNTFLDADELTTDFVERIDSPQDPLAIELEYGNFYWNKADEKLMMQRREEARQKKRYYRIKNRRGNKQILNNDQLVLGDRSERGVTQALSVVSETGIGSSSNSVVSQSINSVAKVKTRTLVGSLRQEPDQKMAFQLKDVDMAIPRGQLTMIFGECGSGKTSLFCALLGEMNHKYEEPKPKLKLNGSIGFMSQKPWLMAKTIKENIVMDLPFDQERFDHAVKYSALDDDLKMFAEGANRVLAEGGENVSGGQKTRIELARMIYQK